MIFGNYNEEYKHCILNCKNGKHFFRVPNSPKTRKIWLDKLGLKLVNVNSRVCNNHFSEQMLTQSGKRLTKTAIPDRNIPSMNGDFELGEDAADQLESMIEHLLNREDMEQKSKFKAINVPSESTVSGNNIRKTNKSIQGSQSNAVHTEKFKGDASKLLMNYQLRNQGKHVCDVTEIPQFILVFTAFRAQDTFIIPPNDLVPEYLQIDDHSTEVKPRAVRTLKTDKPLKNKKVSKIKDISSKDELIEPELPSREIKYVHYTPRENIVQREREIQVDASCIREATDIGVQCNVEEETEAPNDDGSELDWINHIIKAHVFNAEGDMYECHICGEIAASYASKLQHSLVHTESSSLCSKCGRIFTNHVKLRNHEKRMHLENKLEIKKAMRCPKFHCTKAFHSRKQLFDHIDQHTKKTEKKCSKCLRSFSSSLQLHCHKSRKNCWR